ncbi:YSIRK signal domain/LPXTG anchor domain surface protein [Streptococcus plurextorum]|uniref:YSIRK signal domain/LPXTG anchor domain surface protein n=1 Tax=Streptococcus plurextorum TaxID=456876 RepID=UPI0003F61063|nr:YSIRK signal domain/LPXTG anchor domain surface protein [Streptococcus plurextorum]
MLDKSKIKLSRQRSMFSEKRFRYSIRKFNVGVASVAIAAFMLLGNGAVAKADSTLSEASPEVASSALERSATINYIVQYVLEDGTLVNASLANVTVTTQDAVAKTTVTVTADLPEGYELAAGQEATLTQEVTENAENIVTIKVAKKAEVAVASTEAVTSEVSTPSATAETTVASAPETVEEAKTVLEQVISEAEVLANEAERLEALDNAENPSLTVAAVSTKLAVTDATATLNDAVATLGQVNAQIDAIRTNVAALALELRKFYPNGDIVALLNTSTSTTATSSLDVNNPNSIYYAQHGEWYIPDPVKAANSGLPVGDQPATITEAVKTLPDGYIGDQDANRDTFLILNLDTKDGYGDGNNFNDWVGKNYYVVFSVSTIASEREANDVVYAKLVEKTTTGSTVVNTITLTPGVSNTFTELRVLEGNATRNTTYGFTYNVQTVNGGTTRTLTINNTNGNNKNTFLYNKLEPNRVGEEFTIATANVTGSTTQTTTHYVKENEATERPREMLAKYTQTDGLIGDNFHIAGALDFNNYELLATELPSVTSGTLKSDYVVGTQTLQLRPNGNEARLITITDLDGSVQQQIYMLDPNNPDWAKFYKANINNATLSDLKDYFKLMFTSEVLVPGAYNTKEGTFSEKFYEASKLVLESTVVQVMDVNGDVLGTLSDDKSTITTKHGATLPVASTTDSMVTGADGTIYLINYHKIYKTDSAGNYVDANGNVLTPIIWDVATPSNPFVPGIYGPSVSGTDTVTISTGPLTATTYPEAIWYFGYNYKTSSTETRLKDGETDSRWDLGGTELGMRNTNAKNEQHARYWYVEKGGVEVYYIDTDGNVFTNFTAPDNTTVTDKVTLVGHGDTDSAYDTTTVRYEKITAADGTVYWYKAIDTTTANLHPVVNDTTDTDYRANEKIEAETGKIATDTVKQITYVYEKAGSVIVHYVDQDGNPLEGITDAGATTASTVTDTDNGQAGSTYDTKDLKPNTITTADGKIYRLVPAATKGDETGTVVSGETKEVTYVYQLVKGDVIVHYVDTDGNTIADTVTDQTVIETGTDYNTTDNKPEKIVNDTTGDVYYILPTGSEIQAGSAAETGKVVEGTTEVTYVYQKAGNVKVNYTLADGTVIKDPVFDETNQKPGYGYNTTDNKPETITTTDGKVYRLVPTATVGNETGDVESGKTIEVTYIYEEVKSDVVVEYYDTLGNTIAKTVTDTDDASVGTVYNTDEDNRPDTITTDAGVVYYYKEVKDTSASTTGKVAETTTTVQYVYEKAGSVTVNYVTTNGIVIKTPVKDEENAKPGSPYDTTDNKPNTITTEDGKTYRLVPNKTTGEENGTITSGQDKQVTYVYEEVKGDVVVEYYDTKGNLISGLSETGVVIDSTEVDTPLSSTGTAYNTDEDNRPSTITTADGKVYYYKAVKDTSAATTGQVVEGTTTVQYVYEEAGNVVINYITEDGTVIKTPVNDETNVPAGKSYDTTDNKPNTITTADGTVYELIPSATIGNENGSVESGQTTQVTYVYRKVVTPNHKTVTNHVDENGNPIAPQEEGSTPNKSIPGYEFTGKTITDKDGNVTHIYRKVVTPNHKTVTNHVDENGNPIAPQEEGSTPNKSIPGYEFTGKTITDKDGNVTHIYRKVTGTVTPKVPGEQGGTVTQTGHQAEELPNTGEEHSVISALGLAMVAAAFGMSAKRRRDEE